MHKFLLGSRRGQAMVEFSLLAPVFFLLLVGVLDLGRAGFYFVLGSDLARQGARYGSAWGNNGSGYTDPTVAGMVQQQAKAAGIGTFGVPAVALFAVVSLAIDGGRVLMDQRSLQNLADGAALTAGADIGPGADATTSGTAQDDAVLSIERALGIDFSNNYTCPGPAWCAGGQAGALTHRLLGGPCAPWACTPTTAGGNHGPCTAITAGVSPCCTNWTDTTGGYLLNITTPFSCCG